MKKYLSLLILAMLFQLDLTAQTYYTLDATSNGNTYTIACGANNVFRDSGPTTTHYGNNQNYTITFYSGSSDLMRFDFGCGSCYTNDRIDPSDTMYIYDGIGTGGILLAKVTGNPANTNKLDYFFGGGGSDKAFLSLSNYITFRFVSDGAANEDGWEMGITCVPDLDCNGNEAASDLFGGAPFICNLNGYCGQTSGNYDQDFPGNLTDAGGSCPGPLFGGTIENNSWLQFEADSSTVNFTFNVSGCSVGIQVAIFAWDGTNFTRMSPCAFSDGGHLGTFSLSATGLTVGQTYYLMTDGNAGDICNFTVNVSSGVAVISAGPDISVCTGGAANLSANGPSGATYIWNSLDGAVVNVSGANQTFYPTVTTTYVVSVSGSTVCNAQSDTVVVNVNAGTNPVINAAGPFCSDDLPVLLSASVSGGTWSGTGITNGSTGQFSPIIAGPGTYTIYYNVSSPCAGADTISIQVNTTADATILSTGPFCQADSPVNLTAAQAGGTWSGQGITDPINGTFDPAAAGIGNHLIIYQIGGSCGDVDSVIMGVVTSTDATIDPAGPFCLTDGPVNLTAADAGGSWSGTGITNAGLGTFNPNTAGIGSHQVIYTISGSCGDSDTITLVVNPSQDATIDPAGPFCVLSGSVNLTAADAGGSWSGTGITNAGLGTFDPATAGVGSHQIIYTISGSCGDADTINIVVSSIIDATINAAGPYCESDGAVTLTAANAGGTWSGSGITNTSSGTFDPGTAGVGNHVIIYTISGNCGDADTITINVTASADASITAAGPYCINDNPVSLNAADPGGLWSGIGITNTANGTFDPGTAGVGSHVIIYTISGSCGDADTITINVTATADASINPAGPYCNNGSPVGLTAASSGGTWSGTGITDAVTGQFSPAVAGTGTFDVIYTISGLCGNADTISILVNPAPTANLSTTDETCTGNYDGTASVSGSGGTPPYTYLWQTSATTANITGLAPGSYTVIVSDANDCTFTGTANILGSPTPCEVVIPVVYLPSVFSPNGDGENDVLYVRGQGIASFELRIYDRWGEMVFQTTDLSSGWDGSFRGRKMDNGSFVYMLQVDFSNGEQLKEKGSISIIK